MHKRLGKEKMNNKNNNNHKKKKNAGGEKPMKVGNKAEVTHDEINYKV